MPNRENRVRSALRRAEGPLTVNELSKSLQIVHARVRVALSALASVGLARKVGPDTWIGPEVPDADYPRLMGAAWAESKRLRTAPDAHWKAQRPA